MGDEQRIERVAEPRRRGEGIHVHHVPVPADRETPVRGVADEGQPPGHPLVTEAVPHGAVEVGEREARRPDPIAESERDALDPIVAERVGEALVAEAVPPLPGHRVG